MVDRAAALPCHRTFWNAGNEGPIYYLYLYILTEGLYVPVLKAVGMHCIIRANAGNWN